MRCAAKPVTKKPPAGTRSSSSSTSPLIKKALPLQGGKGGRSGGGEGGGSAVHAVELHYGARSVGCKPRAAHGAEHLDDRGGAFVGLLIRHLAHGGCDGILSRQGLHAP